MDYNNKSINNRIKEAKMNKQKLLKVVTILMFFVFLCLVLSAVLNDTIPRKTFRTLHPVLGFVFSLCAVTHISLNWNWIRNNVFKRKEKHTEKEITR